MEIPYPVYDGPWTPAPVPPALPPTIGWTGLRGDGISTIAKLCAHRGWHLNASTAEWRMTPDEITRLSASTLIVLWYFASGRGQSLALATACATRRPVLINDSRMFRAAWSYGDQIYRAGLDPAPPLLEPAIDAVLDAVYKQRAKVPSTIVDERSWARAIATMEATWTWR